MRKLFILIAIALSFNIYADWRDIWADAVEKCHLRKFDEAVILFSQCIEEIESLKENKYPHVYVDRARVYLILERYQDALNDVNKAFESPLLCKKELARALVTRIAARSNLGITDGVVDDLSALNESSPDAPEIEFTKKHIIIKNVPDSECFKNIFSSFLIVSGYCQSEENIKMLSSGIWIVDRNENCAECNPFSNQEMVNQPPKACYDMCDHFAVAGSAFCAKTFKSWGCQLLCLNAVELIRKQICYPCCDSGDFWQKCVKPFEKILEHVGNRCDPAWD